MYKALKTRLINGAFNLVLDCLTKLFENFSHLRTLSLHIFDLGHARIQVYDACNKRVQEVESVL